MAPTKCFNPCCIGLGIQTHCRAQSMALSGIVSILVVLDWVFKPGTSFSIRPTGFSFQSLLYWIGYSNHFSSSLKRIAWHSFNPCCIGLGIQTVCCRVRGGVVYEVSILVVLDWVFKPYELPVQCVGLLVSILVVLDWVFKPPTSFAAFTQSFTFQSLLYWIGYSNEFEVFEENWLIVMFQSLLYWIGYSNRS